MMQRISKNIQDKNQFAQSPKKDTSGKKYETFFVG